MSAATTKQIKYLTDLGGTVTPGMTKSEASAAISALAGRPSRTTRRWNNGETRGRCEDAPCCGHSECGFGPSSPGYGSMVGGMPYYGEGR
jgi:hypothetical protein